MKSLLKQLSNENDLCYYIYNNKSSEDLPLSVRLEMKIEGRIYEAWGVSNEKDLAFFKALMELIERVTLNNSCSIFFRKNIVSRKYTLSEISEKFKIPLNLLYPHNTNGSAIHISRGKAKESALHELIERHVILTALYLNIPPQKYKMEVDALFNEGHEISYYFWKCGPYYVVVAMDKLPNGGFTFTHSCSKDISKAQRKAFEELVPHILYYNSNPNKSEDSTNIKPNDISSFSKYWKYSGDDRVAFFLESKNRNLNIPSLKNIFFSQIEIPHSLNKFDFPIYCMRAISPEAQQLFFDEWNESYINPIYRKLGVCPDFPHFIS